MANNPYVKPLKAFDPKKDLLVNESFKADDLFSREDTLGDLESGEPDGELQGDAGKELVSFRADAPVQAGILSVATALNTTVLIACNDKGGVYLLAPGQGSLTPVGKFKIPGSIIRTPAYSGGILYITTREGLIVAVNTGLGGQEGDGTSYKPSLLWQKRMAKGILSEPVATGKILIVAALDGVYGFEAYYQDDSSKAIGKLLWEKQLDGTVSSPTLHGGMIFIGTEDKKLCALEYGGSKAETKWTFDANAQIRNKPSISRDGRDVLAASIDGSVYCVDIRQKKLEWVFMVKAPVYSTIIPGTIDNAECYYFGDDNGMFYCVNSFGKSVWTFKTNGKIRTQALLDGGVVFFGSEDNNFYALNAKTGAMIFKFSTDGNINSTPVILENAIYFGANDSFIHGISR